MSLDRVRLVAQLIKCRDRLELGPKAVERIKTMGEDDDIDRIQGIYQLFLPSSASPEEAFNKAIETYLFELWVAENVIPELLGAFSDESPG